MILIINTQKQATLKYSVVIRNCYQKNLKSLFRSKSC